jgi:hypothetical protein
VFSDDKAAGFWYNNGVLKVANTSDGPYLKIGCGSQLYGGDVLGALKCGKMLVKGFWAYEVLPVDLDSRQAVLDQAAYPPLGPVVSSSSLGDALELFR